MPDLDLIARDMMNELCQREDWDLWADRHRFLELAAARGFELVQSYMLLAHALHIFYTDKEADPALDSDPEGQS